MLDIISVQGGRTLAQATESLLLNSRIQIVSQFYSDDGWKPAQLGNDIHSPIQSVERWHPLGHKSTHSYGAMRGPFQRQASIHACKARKNKHEREREADRKQEVELQFSHIKLCTDNKEKAHCQQMSTFHSEMQKSEIYHSVLWILFYVTSGCYFL